MKMYRQFYPESLVTPDAFNSLVTNKVIELDKSLFVKCENFIKDFYKITRKNPKVMSDHERSLLNSRVANRSVLMAYDFHVDQHNNPKLIEVNTNAAGYLPVHLLYRTMDNNLYDPDLMKLKESFYRELTTFYSYTREPEYTAIIDEQLENQKMMFEFKMYSHLFSQWGWKNGIHSFEEAVFDKELNTVLINNKKVDFIYNRYCDFLLERPESKSLCQAFLNKACVFSPNPKEYLLAADKSRMIELSEMNVNSVILNSYYISEVHPDELWSKRKHLFFKPLRSHGGKQSYRGSSISRKVFERLLEDQNFTAQEYIPAPTVEDKEGAKWKFDLRFYVYKDEIQQAAARIYQGQVTNFQTPGGGFTAVDFV